MLVIGILLIAVISIVSLLSIDNTEKVMTDFCRVECKQNIQRKYKFCCRGL